MGPSAGVISKISWRLLPFMFLLYIVAYLDRINVSFAGLQMNRDLGFSDQVFGLGSGIFFVGYFIFGVPSNMLVDKLGARRWISIIMVIWGAISMCFSVVTSELQFYVLRFLLGVAEAGFFPGMILYLTFWFPARERGLAVARFMTAIPAAAVLGALISSAVLSMHGIAGIPGWKWLFLVTGLPSVLLGIAVLFYLTDSPDHAHWLSKEEKNWLKEKLELELEPARFSRQKEATVFASRQLWLLALLYFCITLGMYGYQLWLPQIVKGFGHLSDSTTALLTAIPALFQAVGMVLIAASSDKKAERKWHLALSALVAATALVLAGLSTDPVLSLALLSISACGIWGTVGPFWAIPTACLPRTSAAAGIGLINSVGNLGGFAGPFLVGAIKENTGSFFYCLLMLAVSLVVAALIALFAKFEGKGQERVNP